jgi:hypothetical protein
VHSRRDTVLLVALAVILVVLATVAGREAADERLDPRASSHLSGPRGTLALYETLRALDVPVDRWLRPYEEADTLPALLALVAPSQALTPDELAILAGRVRAGGTLLLATGPWAEGALLDTLGLQLDTVPRAEGEGARRFDWSGAAAGAEAHRWTEGVDSVAGFRRVFADTAAALVAGAEPLLSVRGRAAAVVYPMGEGRVVAFADVEPLVNERLRESGAAVVLARAAAEAARPGLPLHFDEYHHGYREGGTVVGATLRFLRERPAGNAVLHLAAAGVLLLLLLGRRFGAPYPPPPVRRRSPLEHVEALAGAYRQAGARRTARGLLLAGMNRRLGRRPAADDAAMGASLERMSTQLPVGREAAAELLEEWRRGGRADLVALTRGVDLLLEEVRRT